MSALRDPVDVLQSARSLALRVSDKNIGPLSEQARELLGEINECLGDLPTVEEVQAIFRDAYREGDRCEVCGYWWWNDGKWHSLIPKLYAAMPDEARWTRCPDHHGDRPTPAFDARAADSQEFPS